MENRLKSQNKLRRNINMKWVCSVCGYVYEGEKAPEQCPVCKAPASKFIKQEAEMA